MELNPEIVGGVIMSTEASSTAAEMPNVKLKTAFAYSSGNLGAGVFFALNNYFLPVLLSNLGASAVLRNLLASSHSFEGAFIQPVVGAWSDRTWLPRLGRRRPFIVWFVPFTILFLVLTPLIPGLQGILPGFNPTLVLVAVSVAIFLFSFTFNIAYDPYQALLPDITPARQRGTINGIFQAIGASGQVVFLLIAIALIATIGVGPLFLISAGVMLIFFIPTLLGVHEPQTLVGATTHARYKLRDYWQGLISDPQILLYFASQFLLWFGINAIAVNLTTYATKGLGFSEGIAFTLPLVLLLTSALPVWPLGILSDRLGLKTVFLFGVICMAGASIGAIFVRDLIPLYVLLTIAGIGNAAQTATSYPLMTRIVFPDTMGLFTGLNTAVTSIAAPASSIIAGLLIDNIGFTAMFPFIATMFVLSLIPLIPLTIEKSKAARALRALQSEGATMVSPTAE